MQKILIRGGIAVGKSMLASALMGRGFDPSYRATLGAVVEPAPDFGAGVWLWDMEGETALEGCSAYALGRCLSLCLADATDGDWREQLGDLAKFCNSETTAILKIVAKSDMVPVEGGDLEIDGHADLAVSAKTGEGIAQLRQLILARLGDG